MSRGQRVCARVLIYAIDIEGRESVASLSTMLEIRGCMLYMETVLKRSNVRVRCELEGCSWTNRLRK